jgi:exonuclease SbcC
MKLVLENFCCYTSQEFVFPSKGTVLLAAPSGSGKTSILRAILFALYGVGNKIVKFGCKKCSVQLDYLGMSIKRSKGPHRLIVTIPGAVMEDEEAQHYIDNVINQTSLCSLDQSTKNSFVHLSAPEKLLYLEKLAVAGDADLNDLKKSLKDNIKTLETTDIILATELATFSQIIKDIHTKLSHQQRDNTEQPCDMTQLQNTLNLLATQHKDVQHAMANYTQTEHENEKIRCNLKLLSREQSLNQNKQTHINYDATILSEKQKSLTQLETNLCAFVKYEAYAVKVDKYNSLKTLYKSLKPASLDKITDIKSSLEQYPTVSILDSQLQLLFKQLQDLRKFLAYKSDVLQQQTELKALKADPSLKEEQGLLEQLHEYKTMASNITYACPSCESTLQLFNKKLRAVKKMDQLKLNESIKDLESRLSHITEIRTSMHTLTNSLKKMTLYLDSSQALEGLLIEDIEAKLDELKEQKSEVIRLSTLLREYMQENVILTDQYNQVKTELKALHKECSLVVPKPSQYDIYLALDRAPCDPLRREIKEHTRDIQELRNNLKSHQELQREYEDRALEISRLQARIREIPDGVLQLPEELCRLERLIEQVRNDMEKYREYEMYYSLQQELAKYTEKYDLVAVDKKKNMDSIVAHQKLKKIIQQAETQSLNNIIYTINTNIQIYLDAFFPDDPMTVSITTTKMVKKVATPSIELDIRYKDEDITISTLSGGELSRLVLVFALVISEVNNSPLIILDESLSTLDAENCSNVYDYIKENCGDKLIIIVAHQLITGMFDHIVEF